MRYIPKRCSDCGEKIERDERQWLTTHFCGICESEFKTHDWMPRLVLGIGVLFAVFGIGSLLKKTDRPLNVTTTSFPLAASNKNSNLRNTNGGVQKSTSKQPEKTVDAQSDAPAPEVVSNISPPETKRGLPETWQKIESEPVYFCGAQTKKGTACTRRVKGGGRCWQHKGQAAILPPEKLVARR